MELLSDIIYHQNKTFLEKIANDMFCDQQDKDRFIQKYHKKHFSFFQVKKQDKINSYQKTIERCVKLSSKKK